MRIATRRDEVVYGLQFETLVGLPGTNPESSLQSDLSRATEPSIEVDVQMDPPVVDGEPTTQTLLERAAALGPVRLTFESIAVPDPVLEAKFEPRIAQRRARLTRVVKATLGACVGVCVLAIGVSIFSGGEAQAAPRAFATKSMPSEVVKSATPLAGAIRGKATKTAPQVPVVVANARPTWRPAKRR